MCVIPVYTLQAIKIKHVYIDVLLLTNSKFLSAATLGHLGTYQSRTGFAATQMVALISSHESLDDL